MNRTTIAILAAAIGVGTVIAWKIWWTSGGNGWLISAIIGTICVGTLFEVLTGRKPR